MKTFYRPPAGSHYLPDKFNDSLNKLLIAIGETSLETILLGDSNVDYAKKSDNIDFKSLLSVNGYTQLVNKPTRITNNTSSKIDIIASSRTDVIKDVKVFATSLSDHEMVSCVCKRNHMRYPAKTIQIRDYSNYNPTNLINELKVVDWSVIYNTDNLNPAVSRLNEILDQTFKRHAPFIKKRVKGGPCPWLDNETKSVKNNRDQVLRRARRSKTVNDWNVYKTLRNRCNNLMKYAKSKFNRNLLEDNKINPKKFWATIKRIYPTKVSPDSTASKHKSESRVEKFSNHYATVINHLKRKAIHLCNFVWRSPTNILPRTLKSFKFQSVTDESILRHLKEFKLGKSPGLDQIPPNLLKDSANAIYQPIAYIINLSLIQSEIPLVWKKAKVTPVFKTGDASNPDNYRPISVLPILSKILERTVHTQLSDFLENENLLSDFQFGFRPNRLTELASTLFIDNIRREVDNGKLVGSIFMDLSRAFDTISHS